MARVQKFNQENFFKKSALQKKEVPIAYFICDRRRSLRREGDGGDAARLCRWKR